MLQVHGCSCSRSRVGSNFRGEESGQTTFLVLTGPLSIRILSSLLSHLRSPASMCVIHSSGALLVACLVGWWNGMSSRDSPNSPTTRTYQSYTISSS